MNLSLPFYNDSPITKIAIWTAAHPVVTRLALLALPVATAMALAAFGHHGFFFMPPTGGGGGGCGGSC